MHMTRNRYEKLIASHLPAGAIPHVVPLLLEWGVELRITGHRRTRQGDYRPPHRGAPHRISINGSLNPYAFLITLIHEEAHLLVQIRGEWKSRPHGPQWKRAYRELMAPLLTGELFPEEIRRELRRHIKNPGATTHSDHDLMRVLKSFDPPSPMPFLEELPESSLFLLHGKRLFEKGKKRRKRFLCREVESSRLYLISPLMRVEPYLRPGGLPD